MYLYYLCFGVLLTFVIGKTTTETARYWTVGSILFVVAAVRGSEVDRDYLGYLDYYTSILQHNFQNVEPSFILLTQFVDYLFGEPLFLFVIYAGLGIFIKVFAINRLTKYRVMTLVVYYCSFFLIWEMTQIRAAVAGAIMLLAIVPLAERKYLQYILLCCVASVFQYTALVMFLIIWINTVNLNRFAYALAIPAASVLWLSSISLTEFALLIPLELVQLKIRSSQSQAEFFSIPFNYIYVARCLFAYFLLFYASYFSAQNRCFLLILKLYVIGLSVHVALFAVPGVASRLSEFFLVVEVLLVPMLIGLFREKVVGYSLVFFFAVMLLVSSIQGTELLSPYQVNKSLTTDLI